MSSLKSASPSCSWTITSTFSGGVNAVLWVRTKVTFRMPFAAATCRAVSRIGEWSIA